MKITTVGIDFAKSVFHIVAVNNMGTRVKKTTQTQRTNQGGGIVDFTTLKSWLDMGTQCCNTRGRCMNYVEMTRAVPMNF